MRSGYAYDFCGDELELGRWRGQVASSLRGKRGQRFLRDLIDALDAMPEKVLIAGAFERDGKVCASGAVGRLRGVSLADLNPSDDDLWDYSYDVESPWNCRAAERLDVAVPLIAEVEEVNDGFSYGNESDEDRWKRVRLWAARHLREEA